MWEGEAPVVVEQKTQIRGGGGAMTGRHEVEFWSSFGHWRCAVVLCLQKGIRSSLLARLASYFSGTSSLSSNPAVWETIINATRALSNVLMTMMSGRSLYHEFASCI